MLATKLTIAFAIIAMIPASAVELPERWRMTQSAWSGPLCYLMRCLALLMCPIAVPLLAFSGEVDSVIQVGLAVRDITPAHLASLWSQGTPHYQSVDTALRTKAVALQSGSGAKVVLVSVDTLSLNADFTDIVLERLAGKYGLTPVSLILVSSHSHTAGTPRLKGKRPGKSDYPGSDSQFEYGQALLETLVDVVEAALNDLKPSRLEFGVGQATFAMNRRVFTSSGDAYPGLNPYGPHEWEVPVMKITSLDGSLRGVLFGYACHDVAAWGSTAVSPDYSGYAERQLEAVHPGAIAAYLTGFGGDQNPFPRSGEPTVSVPWRHAESERNELGILYAKRHGLELAGAVEGVLNRPMSDMTGPVNLAYREILLPLTPGPSKEQIREDAKAPEHEARRLFKEWGMDEPARVQPELENAVKLRAEAYQAAVDRTGSIPKAVPLRVSVMRVGELTMLFVGGEVVVDYVPRLKALLVGKPVWLVGYAYDVPAYIPSARLLKEGGYEPVWSMFGYGWYGHFLPRVEEDLVGQMWELVQTMDAARGKQ